MNSRPTSNRRSQEAAELLWRLWRDGDIVEALPDPIRPESRDEGYAIQSFYEANSARPLYGWKIAATSVAGQTHINVAGPIAGRLLAERAFASGDVLAFGANRMRVVEPEFAFRFGRDLGPRETPYGVEEVIDAVDTLHPAIEIPDSRFEDVTSVGEAQLIADNACAHEFVLGPRVEADWRSIDLTRHVVNAEVTGADGASKLSREGIGSNVLGDPRLALAWLVNEVTGLGITLGQGQVVTTGTCAVPLAVDPGDRVNVDFGVLGTVGLAFAPV